MYTKSRPKPPKPTTKLPSQILIEAFNLINEPGNWTQGEYARLPSGRDCSPTNSHAVCFCSVGAISQVSGLHPDSPVLQELLSKFQTDPVIHSVVRLHDESTLLRINDRAESVDDPTLVQYWTAAIFHSLAKEDTPIES